MSSARESYPARRNVLRTAVTTVGAVTVGGLLRPAVAAADATAKTITGVVVRRWMQLVDDTNRQRFRVSSTKPPILHDGTSYPPSMRNGPDDATWVTFNDQNQDEKGGLTISTDQESLSFDYVNAEAVSVQTIYEGTVGQVELSMYRQPDPSIPILEVTGADNPVQVLLHTDNAPSGFGSGLLLCDAQGRPRIVLQVDPAGDPTIQLLDADGEVVAQLPDTGAASRPGRDAMRTLLSRPRSTSLVQEK